MKKLTTIATFLLLTAMSANAAADDLVAQAKWTTAYYQDPSFDAVSDFNAKTDFALHAAVQMQRMFRFGLLFQTAPRLETTRFGGAVDYQYGRQKIYATGEWGFYPYRFLRPSVQLGAGYVHQFLSARSVGPRLKDHAHDIGGYAALGLEAGVPVRWGNIALTTSVGYELQTTANFDEMRHDKKAFDDEYAPDDDPWTRAEGDLGKLNTSGIFWSLGLSVSFDVL